MESQQIEVALLLMIELKLEQEGVFFFFFFVKDPERRRGNTWQLEQSAVWGAGDGEGFLKRCG